MFELLGLALLLAALLVLNTVASLVTAGCWRLARSLSSRCSALLRAQLLFLLRTFPPLLAFLCVAFLLIPAYLAYEPRHTNESVSFKLFLLALCSAGGIAVALTRMIAAWHATAKLRADWLRQGEAVRIPGLKIPSFRIDHAFPVIAIIGVWRPRLFVASKVLKLLSPEELAAAVAHENGHLTARDNLKRALMRACRDALLIIPAGRLLDRGWAEAAEEAADENAAEKGVDVALDLAAALVKIARNIPSGARPAMPAGVFLVGDEGDDKGIKSRVRKLIDLAASNRPKPHFHLASIFSPQVCAATLGLTLILFLTHAASILAAVHGLIERAVHLLA